jgi:hypothetical protein
VHLVFERSDGTASAVPVNGMSEVRVQTWTPPVFDEGGVPPVLVEDQTIAMNDVVAVRLSDGSDGAEVLAGRFGGQPEEISQAEADRLDSEWVSAPKITSAPWDEAA